MHGRETSASRTPASAKGYAATYIVHLTLFFWLHTGHANTLSSFGIFFFGRGFLLLFRLPCRSAGAGAAAACVRVRTAPVSSVRTAAPFAGRWRR